MLRRECRREAQRIDVGLAHQVHDLLRVRLFLRQIIDRNVGALARESDRRSAADAAVAAGDQRVAAKQTTGAAIALLAMIRARRHAPSQTRPRLRLFLKGRSWIEFARVAQFPRGRRIIEAEHGGGGFDRALCARSANRLVCDGFLSAHLMLPLLDLRHAGEDQCQELNAARPRLFQRGYCVGISEAYAGAKVFCRGRYCRFYMLSSHMLIMTRNSIRGCLGLFRRNSNCESARNS